VVIFDNVELELINQETKDVDVLEKLTVVLVEAYTELKRKLKLKR
jgi:hypothetical protein